MQDPYNKQPISCQKSGQLFKDTSKESVYITKKLKNSKFINQLLIEILIEILTEILIDMDALKRI